MTESELSGVARRDATGRPSGDGTLAFGPDAPLLDVMRTMRAMRRLRPDPVPRELLEELVAAATWAPSGGNTQAYRFVIVTDREQIARITPIWRKQCAYYVRAQQAVPPQHTTPEKWSRVMAALRYQADHMPETPALIVACYEKVLVRRLVAGWRQVLPASQEIGLRAALRMLPNIPRFVQTGEAACIYPAVQNLLLAARAHGLGATLTTWHTLFEPQYKRILGIPRGVRTYAIVPVGWPRGKFGPLARVPAADAISWERWT
jgi:nitroreductase